MIKKTIYYKSGYKYQLYKNYRTKIDILGHNIHTKYIILENGKLLIKKGYCWDGASGPTIDTKNSMRASLVHDALYQLCRMCYLDSTEYKNKIDKIFYNICIEDGMLRFRAWLWYIGVRKFGKSSTSWRNLKKVLKAP